MYREYEGRMITLVLYGGKGDDEFISQAATSIEGMTKALYMKIYLRKTVDLRSKTIVSCNKEKAPLH